VGGVCSSRDFVLRPCFKNFYSNLSPHPDEARRVAVSKGEGAPRRILWDARFVGSSGRAGLLKQALSVYVVQWADANRLKP
jgi:hypothetical protein